LIPCGHRVCQDCWTEIVEDAERRDEGALCPLCRQIAFHVTSPDLYHDAQPLYSRFCVQLPGTQASLAAPVQSRVWS
jgi:hypothetical protein